MYCLFLYGCETWKSSRYVFSLTVWGTSEQLDTTSSRLGYIKEKSIISTYSNAALIQAALGCYSTSPDRRAEMTSMELTTSAFF